MARYFFHIRADDDELILDEEGMELANLTEARAEATKGIRDILAEKLRSGEPLDHEAIEIADGKGQVLDVVRFEETFKLHR